MSSSYLEFEKALKRLDEVLKLPETDIIRDSAIQRFEFCVELSWKTAKKVLGLSASSPKQVLREMAQAGLIQSPELWFTFVEARNLSTHTYKEELAVQVYGVAKIFLPHGLELLAKIKEQ